jgi:prepilin peptidase CpaA
MHSIAWWPSFFTVLIAAITDLRSRRIPNWLVVISLLGALVTAGATQGASGLGKSLAGAAVGGAILGVLYLLGGMGMGDVKLCAAVGAWLGPAQLLMALVVMGVAGGAMALVWAACGGFLKDSLRGAGDLVCGLGQRGLRRHPSLTLGSPGARSIPYAPAIAIGVIFSFLAHS